MTRIAIEVDIRVSVTRISTSDDVLLRFERMSTRRRKDFILRSACARIDALRNDLPALMTPVRQVIGFGDRLTLSPEDAADALDRLNALAWGTLRRLLAGATMDGSPARPVGAQTFVREVSALLFAPPLAPGKPWQRPFAIEVCASDDMPLAWHLPVELIPLDLPVPEGGMASAPRLSAAFLGMAAVVTRRRRANEADPPSRPRRGTPLTVVSTADGACDLQGVQRQRAYFAARATRFAIDDTTQWPWDPSVKIDAARKELASILTATQAAAARGKSRPVLHICCHYGLHDGVPSIGIKRDLQIGVTALGGELAQPPHPEHPPKDSHRPLVFLNACSSAAGQRGDESLLQLLFERGFHHVIGGETLLPERVAGEFACCFYDFVLSGDPVGLALWRTRQHFAQAHRSPAGLLYTYYGSPEIRVG